MNMKCEREPSHNDEQQIRNILNDYHHRLLREKLMGPTISVVTHCLLLALLLLLIPSRDAEVLEKPPVAVIQEEDLRVHTFPKPSQEKPIKIDGPQTRGLRPKIKFPTQQTPIITQTSPICTPPSPLRFRKLDDGLFPANLAGLVTGPIGDAPINNSRTKERWKTYVIDVEGPLEGQDSVDRALAWLASVQNKDGSWGKQSPAHTGLALLAFLARGQVPQEDCLYAENSHLAINWLIERVNESKDGNVGQKAYGHAIATYALAEAYAMTLHPRIRGALEKATEVIICGQQENGGFDYNYRKGDRWDLSVSGWQMQALKAARMAGARNANLDRALCKSILFCRRTAYKDGKFGYSSPGTGGNMTGVGALSLQLLDGEDSPELRRAIKTITETRYALLKQVKDDPSKWDDIAAKNLYGWYYETQAVFNNRIIATGRRSSAGKKKWRTWCKTFEGVLNRAQHEEGYWEVAKGNGLGTSLEGRIMATCWSTLQLEVYYRIGALLTTKTKETRADAAALARDNINKVLSGDDKLIIEIE